MSREPAPSTEMWDQNDLHEKESNLLDSPRYTDVMNDDFFEIDGLEIEDDFNGLLDIGHTYPFESLEKSLDSSDSSDSKGGLKSKELSSKETKEIQEAEEHFQEKRKRPLDDIDPFRTPFPLKKRRAIEPHGFLSPSSCSSSQSIRSIASLRSEPDSPDSMSQYKAALKHLALSMQRSERTRSEIIRQRKIAETQAKLRAVQAKNMANADCFLHGSRSTLTIGLEQSRHMLKSYLGQMRNNMFR